jgi:hypothetical protein
MSEVFDFFKSDLINEDNTTYQSASNPGTLYLRDSGDIQEDYLIFSSINTLQELTNYMIDDVKLYVAGHVTYEVSGYLMDGGVGSPIYDNLWHFMGTEIHTFSEITNVLGNYWGGLTGCTYGITKFADDVMNYFAPDIKNYLYE